MTVKPSLVVTSVEWPPAYIDHYNSFHIRAFSLQLPSVQQPSAYKGHVQRWPLYTGLTVHKTEGYTSTTIIDPVNTTTEVPHEQQQQQAITNANNNYHT